MIEQSGKRGGGSLPRKKLWGNRALVVLCLLVAIFAFASCGGPSKNPSGQESSSDATGKGKSDREEKKKLSYADQLKKMEEEKKKALEEELKKIPDFDLSDTLEGPDADNDGVRDDIQSYIDNLPIREEMKEKLRKVAKKYREIMLLDLSNGTKLSDFARDFGNVIGCVVVSASSEEKMQYSKYLDILQAASANTMKRAKKYSDFNDALSGHVFGANGDPCEEENN